MTQREPVEKIGLRAILYSQATLTVLLCLTLGWLIVQYSLLPNIFFRLAAVLALFVVAFIYVPRSIRLVNEEMTRRGAK